MQKNNFAVKILIVGLLAVVLRLGFAVYLGPQWEPDSFTYMDVSRVLANTGHFATQNPVSGQLTPQAMRVPLFHLAAASLIKVFGPDAVRPVIAMNIILSVATVLMTFYLFSFFFNINVGFLAGLLMAIDPNSVYNSILLMPDTLFSFLCLAAIVTGVFALRSTDWKWYFFWGMAIGLAAMAKPVFKYFWLVALIVLVLQHSNWRSWSRYGLVLLLGSSLVIGPWLIRNHRIFGFWGLDLATGIGSIWSTTDLIKLSTEQQRQDDPELAKVRDVVVHSREEIRQVHPEMFNDKDIFAQFNYGVQAWQQVQSQLGLSLAETDRMLTRLGLETAIRNPGIVGKRFALNVINFLNSPASLAELVCRIIPGGKVYRQPLSVAWQERNWTVVAPTILVRLLYAAVVFLAVWGLVIYWRGPDHYAAWLIALTIFYFTFFSFTAGYDRYRLPIDPLFLGLAAYTITRKVQNEI